MQITCEDLFQVAMERPLQCRVAKKIASLNKRNEQQLEWEVKQLRKNALQNNYHITKEQQLLEKTYCSRNHDTCLVKMKSRKLLPLSGSGLASCGDSKKLEGCRKVMVRFPDNIQHSKDRENVKSFCFSHLRVHLPSYQDEDRRLQRRIDEFTQRCFEEEKMER